MISLDTISILMAVVSAIAVLPGVYWAIHEGPAMALWNDFIVMPFGFFAAAFDAYHLGYGAPLAVFLIMAASISVGRAVYEMDPYLALGAAVVSWILMSFLVFMGDVGLFFDTMFDTKILALVGIALIALAIISAAVKCIGAVWESLTSGRRARSPL